MLCWNAGTAVKMDIDENRFEGMLAGKTVILTVTASISLYRMPDLVRDLRREGARVVVGMSKEAASMISPTIFQWASENDVVTAVGGNIEHISLFIGHAGDTALLICPASHNTLGKIANGISDDVPSLFFSFAIGNGNPVCICPAMHEGMMVNPINHRNLQALKDAGVQIIPPRISEEKAKISENDLIIDHVCRLFHGKTLRGKSVLIIGGRGEEMIDPVRAVSNLGSGFTLSWLAVNAFRLGAASIVMIGNTEYRVPEYAEYIHAVKMEEFEAEVDSILSKRSFDVVINCASLSDFIVKEKSGSKMPGDRSATVTLIPREKLLDRIRKKHSGRLVAFKLDDEVSPDQVYRKVSSSRPDLVVYNSISRGSGPFGTVSNHYIFIRPNDHEDLGILSKPQMTQKVLSLLYSKSTEAP